MPTWGFVSRVDPARFRGQWKLILDVIGGRRTGAQIRQALRTLGVRYVVIEEHAMVRWRRTPPWNHLVARLRAAVGDPLADGGGFTIFRVETEHP